MTTLYTPDKWALVKISSPKGVHHRILAGWQSGYLNGASWKISSGIETFVDYEDYFESLQTSGSIYNCRKNSYGCTSFSSEIYTSYKEDLKKHDTEFLMLTEAEMLNFNK